MKVTVLSFFFQEETKEIQRNFPVFSAVAVPEAEPSALEKGTGRTSLGGVFQRLGVAIIKDQSAEMEAEGHPTTIFFPFWLFAPRLLNNYSSRRALRTPHRSNTKNSHNHRHYHREQKRKKTCRNVKRPLCEAGTSIDDLHGAEVLPYIPPGVKQFVTGVLLARRGARISQPRHLHSSHAVW